MMADFDISFLFLFFIPPLQDASNSSCKSLPTTRGIRTESGTESKQATWAWFCLVLLTLFLIRRITPSRPHSFQCSPSSVVSLPPGWAQSAYSRPHGRMPRPQIPSRSLLTWSKRPSHAWKRMSSTKPSRSLPVRDLPPNLHIPEVPTVRRGFKDMVGGNAQIFPTAQG